jgi:hypothetical protein
VALADTLEQERLQRIDVVGGEHGRAVEDRAEAVGEQDVFVLGDIVLQVGARREPDRARGFVEGGVGVLEVALVLADLGGGVKDVA